MHFHLTECASVPDFSDDSIFNPLFMTSLKKRRVGKFKHQNIKLGAMSVQLCVFITQVSQSIINKNLLLSLAFPGPIK